MTDIDDMPHLALDGRRTAQQRNIEAQEKRLERAQLTTEVRNAIKAIARELGEHHIGGARHPSRPAFHRPDKVKARAALKVAPLRRQLTEWSGRYEPVQVLLVLWQQTYDELMVTMAYNTLRVVRRAAKAFVNEFATHSDPTRQAEALAVLALSHAMELITTEGRLFQLINLSDAAELKKAAGHAASRAKEIADKLRATEIADEIESLLGKDDIKGYEEIVGGAMQYSAFYSAGASAAQAVVDFEEWLTNAPVMDPPDHGARGGGYAVPDTIQTAIDEITSLKPHLAQPVRELCEPWEQMLVGIRDITTSKSAVFVPKKASLRYCYPFAVDIADDGLPWNDEKTKQPFIDALTHSLAGINLTRGEYKALGTSQFFYKEAGHYGGIEVELQGGITVGNPPPPGTDEHGQMTWRVWLELSDMGNHCLCIEPPALIEPRPHEMYRAVRVGTPFVIGQKVFVNEPFPPKRASNKVVWDSLHAFSRDVVVAVAEGFLLGARKSREWFDGEFKRANPPQDAEDFLLADPTCSRWFKAHFEPGNLHEVVVAQTNPPPQAKRQRIATALDSAVGGKVLLRSTHQAASTLAEWVRYPAVSERELTLIDDTPVLGMAGDWFANTGEMTVFGYVAAPGWHSQVYTEAGQFASSWSPLLLLWSRRLQAKIDASQPDADKHGADKHGAEPDADDPDAGDSHRQVELRRIEKKVRLHLMQIRAEDLCATRAHRQFLDQLLAMAQINRTQRELETQLTATEHLTDWYDTNTREEAETKRNVLLAFLTLLGVFGLSGFLAELDKDAGQKFLGLIPMKAPGVWEDNLVAITFAVFVIVAFFYLGDRRLMKKRLNKFRERVSEVLEKVRQLVAPARTRKNPTKEHTVTDTQPPILDMRTEINTEAIETIYHELLETSFGPNELDTLETLLDGLAKDGSYEAWGLCVLDGQTPVGCVLGYPCEQSRALLIGYLVVNPRLRSQGTGSRLITEVRNRWFDDPDYPLVLCEVEDPRHHGVDRGSDPAKRAELYGRQGMQVVVGPYFQPKLEGEGKTRVYNLFLTVVNESNDRATWRDSVSGKQIADFLCEYFRSSGEGEDWPRDDDVDGKRLLAFYRTRERIPLQPIGEWEHIDVPPLTDPPDDPTSARTSARA